MTSLTGCDCQLAENAAPSDTDIDIDNDDTDGYWISKQPDQPTPQRPFVPTKELCETDLILLVMLTVPPPQEQEISVTVLVIPMLQTVPLPLRRMAFCDIRHSH
jgi:hypothetical protein